MQILGQQDMSFSAEATAKYEFTQNFDPASVLMILDNSGSMSYDDKPILFDTNTNRWVYQPETEREELTRWKPTQIHSLPTSQVWWEIKAQTKTKSCELDY